MEKQICDLGSLLQPTSLDTFFASYWEKTLMSVHRGDEGYYEGLLNNKNLENVISSWDSRYPAIMLAKDGVFYPPQAYCEDVKMGQVTFSGVPDLKKLSAEYGRGATIALTSLDRSWRPLSELCTRLEEQLDHGVKTNVYITAGQTAGFPPHYDTHDILMLQIAGKKLWRIYEPTIKLPDLSQACDPKTYRPGAQVAEIELQTGDLLYLPRGYGHAATTPNSHSAHVTVGIHVYTWAGVLKEFDPTCVRVAECRKSLPPGFASRIELRPAIREQLKRLAPAHVTAVNLDRAFDSFVRNVNLVRRRTPARFRMDAVVISLNSLLKTAAESRYKLSRVGDGPNNAAMLMLDFDGNKYSFPGQLEAVLNSMSSRGSFRLRELSDGLNSEALVGLAGYLQGIGFLTSLG